MGETETRQHEACSFRCFDLQSFTSSLASPSRSPETSTPSKERWTHPVSTVVTQRGRRSWRNILKCECVKTGVHVPKSGVPFTRCKRSGALASHRFTRVDIRNVAAAVWSNRTSEVFDWSQVRAVYPAPFFSIGEQPIPKEGQRYRSGPRRRETQALVPRAIGGAEARRITSAGRVVSSAEIQ